MKKTPAFSIGSTLTLALGLTLAACGGGGVGDSSSANNGGFQLLSMSVPSNGAVWQINRPITFRFNQPVRFSTINESTISIVADADNGGVAGNYFLDPGDPSGRTVVFQPACPTQTDLSDAALRPGGFSYTIRLQGDQGGAGLSVESTSGQSLTQSQTRRFVTPNSSELQSLFFDPVNGPVSPRIRPVGEPSSVFTYVEVGGDATQRIYIEEIGGGFNQPGNGPGSIPGDELDEFEDGLPLNLYSQGSSRLAVVMEFDQPVNPFSENISTERICLEAEVSPGKFEAIPTRLTLISNCTETGAAMRLEPIGILRQGVRVRVVVTPEFEDLGAQRNLLPLDNQVIFFTRTEADPIPDEILEDFQAGPESFEDLTASFAEPRAVWGGGSLRPGFDFGGTGTTFDWVVTQDLILDTDQSPVITSADQSQTQEIINGVVNLRNLEVQPGAILRFQGSQPVTINAIGTVTIDGRIDVGGLDARDVFGVATGQIPENGGDPGPGGGTGGTASFLTTTSTPRGGHGEGAFGVPSIGGQGAETSFGKGGVNSYRSGGGGGGRFGPEAATEGNGLKATKGRKGGGAAKGVQTNASPPDGGRPGFSTFSDPDPDNDFFGVRFDTATGEITIGELDRPFAGQGGGAGGDALNSNKFPSSNVQNDHKGGPGGGGAGSLRIRSLGGIILGANGRVIATGGKGGEGQLDCVAGSCFTVVAGAGGGGSGGHIILESATIIDLTAAGDADSVIDARGGNGGKGVNPSTGAGGSGGPGIIQLHAPSGGILVGGDGDLAARTMPPPVTLVPGFGRFSKARSRWIPLGGAAGDSPDDVDFASAVGFTGTDLMDGSILATNQVVDDGASVLATPPVTLQVLPATPAIGTDGRTLLIDLDTVSLTSDIFARNPALLRGFQIVLRDTTNPVDEQRFNVSGSTLDPDTNVLALTVDGSGDPLDGFVAPAIEFDILARFFRVVTNTVEGALPSNVAIRIRFQGTGTAMSGGPDEGNVLVPWTPDISLLSDTAMGTQLEPIDFYQFEVEFDLDALNTGVLDPDTELPELRFLRTPFLFNL